MIQVKSYDDILKEAEFTNLDFSAIDVFRDKFSNGMESSLGWTSRISKLEITSPFGPLSSPMSRT